MFYNILGYYFAYRIMIQDAKEDMRSFIAEKENEEEFVTIVLPCSNGDIADKDFAFVDEDEFIYKGHMFDVASSEIHGGFIYFKCVNDSKEEQVNFHIEKHITDNLTDTPSSSKRSGTIEKNLIKEYISQKSFVLAEPVSGTDDFPPYKQTIITNYSDIETPPPKII